MSDMEFITLAEDAIGVKVESAAAAQRLAFVLRGRGGCVEVVPGLDSVTLQFDPLIISANTVRERLQEALWVPANADPSLSNIIEIPVRYGGEHGQDLVQVCAALGISERKFIVRHTGAEHTVDMIGFTPGFAYISGIDASLSAARLPTPRPRVPAGSVGISGGYTGLYALQGPGGWPLIGRTDVTLFDTAADEPFLLQPGQAVRFVAV